MTTTTTTPTVLTDASLLSEILESPRAVRALEGLGLKTLGDVRAAGIDKVVGQRYIGDVTLEKLRAALGPQATPDKPAAPEPKWEEGMHPLYLHSPSRGFRFPLKRALSRHHPVSGETIEQTPLWVEFTEGEAKLTAYEWALKVHDGDEVKARRDVEAKTPWRIAAIEWLKARRSYERAFFIKTD